MEPSFRFLIDKVLHKEDLCAGVSNCDQVRQAKCGACDAIYNFAIPTRVPNCPTCGARAYVKLRCAGCQLTQLENMLEFTAAGALFNRIRPIDKALQITGMTVTLADITPDELDALYVLAEERGKFEAEQRGQGAENMTDVPAAPPQGKRKSFDT